MQKNVTHNQKKNQSIETEPDMTKIMELTDKNFKTIINLLKNVEENMNMMKEKIEAIKKGPNETLEIKLYNVRNKKCSG